MTNPFLEPTSVPSLLSHGWVPVKLLTFVYLLKYLNNAPVNAKDCTRLLNSPDSFNAIMHDVKDRI